MSLSILALFSLFYHIAIIFFTKLSLVFLSDNSKKIIRDKTWDLTLKLDKLKVKPWLKKIKVTESIYESSLFKIPSKIITIITLITVSIIYYFLIQEYNYGENGILTNKAYFLKIRFIPYITSFLLLTLVIRFFRRFLGRNKISKRLLLITTFFIYWKVSSNLIGLIILLFIYHQTGKIDCVITSLQSLDCNPIFGNYDFGIQMIISFLGIFAVNYLVVYVPLIFGYIAYSIMYLYVTVSSLILNFVTFILYKISDSSLVLKAHIIVFTAFIEIITLLYLFLINKWC